MSDQPTQSAPNWQTLGLKEDILKLIEKAGYGAPTPVQAAAIPKAHEGLDLIVSAATGTGKTASFVLPMVERLAGRRGTFGLILAPTREIAQQIHATLQIFADPFGLKSTVLIGGVDMGVDAKALQARPDIIVGTPGRICDHLERGTLWLDFIEMVVLDEADRMLSMGFAKQLGDIMNAVPESRQTMLFSATFLPSVEKLARQILFDPVRISIGTTNKAQSTVDQRVIWVHEEDRRRKLVEVLREETGSVIIFTRSKDAAHKLWLYLHSKGVYDATYLSSDRSQEMREMALAEFKAGKHRILIATDVAGRGIHVDAVAHVINFELPMDPEDYIHRVGRTGRAQSTGKATSFVTSRDRGLLKDIERIMGTTIRVEGEEPSRRPEADRPRGPREGGERSRHRRPRRGGGRGGRGAPGGGGGRSSST